MIAFLVKNFLYRIQRDKNLVNSLVGASSTSKIISQNVMYVPNIALNVAETAKNWEKTLFQYVDTSKDGLVDFYEFMEFCKYLGLFLKKDTFIAIFAEADQDGDKHLSPNEFDKAFTKLRDIVLGVTKEYLGLTLTDLVTAVILILILLLLLFAFIFLGIAAFSNINGVGPFISALLPVVAGIGAFTRLNEINVRRCRVPFSQFFPILLLIKCFLSRFI
jgi:amino acid transporter